MPSKNEMHIMGHLGQDAKLLANGRLLSFSVACSERYRPKGETEWKEVTTWIPVKWWLTDGTRAVADMLKKGALVQVYGSFTVESYEKDGEKKTFTLCKASLVVPCSWPRSDRGGQPQQSTQTAGGGFDEADYGGVPGGGDDSWPF